MTAERLVALARAAAREPEVTHPYERHCALEERPAAALLRGAARLLADEPSVGIVEGRGGVLLTARDEDSLHRATDLLRAAYGAALRAQPIRARRVQVGAAADAPPLEPVLGVAVQCRWNDVDRIRRDLQRRGARILAARATGGAGAVHATCGAGALLGYARQLHELTGGAARAALAFSHLEPVPGEPPDPPAA